MLLWVVWVMGDRVAIPQHSSAGFPLIRSAWWGQGAVLSQHQVDLVFAGSTVSERYPPLKSCSAREQDHDLSFARGRGECC